MLAATILVLDGVEPVDAWSRIEKARGILVPDTAGQRAWVDANGVARPRPLGSPQRDDSTADGRRDRLVHPRGFNLLTVEMSTTC